MPRSRGSETCRTSCAGLTRRHFFRESGFGIGALGLLSLLEERLFAASVPANDPFALKPTHFAPKAKRVIYLFMAGAPSQVDLFDPKPQLKRHDGEAIPEELVKGERFAFIKGTPRLLGSPFAFEKVGQSGLEVSELLPISRRSRTRWPCCARSTPRSSTTLRRRSS